MKAEFRTFANIIFYMLVSSFKRLWVLLISPQKAWKMVSQESFSKKTYLTGFFYPLVALSCITSFVNPFISGEDAGLRAKATGGFEMFIITFISTIIGYFISANLLNKIFRKWFGQNPGKFKAEILTAYSLAPVLAISIVTRLISEFFFLKIFFLYIFIIIWEAATGFYNVDEKKQGLFTGVTGLIILVIPVLIEILLKLLMPAFF